jgi:CheY-like chemotaxis protein
VVEDDLDVLAAVSELLHEEGYQVACARTGREALGLLENGLRPVAMVVDVMMPEMTGVELLAACSGLPELACIPALLMSASGARELERQGVTLCLRKPFAPDKLLRELDRVLEVPLRQAG